MRKQVKIAILILIFTTLSVAGCRVRSASDEKKDPTPARAVLVNYNSDQTPIFVPSMEVNESLTPEDELATATETLTETPTETPTETLTPTSTITPLPGQGNIQATNTATEFFFPTSSPTFFMPPVLATNTSTIVPPSATPTSTNTNTPLPTFTDTPSPTATHTPTYTYTPSPTNTNTPSPSSTLNITLTITLYPRPSITPQGGPNAGIGGGDASVTEGINGNPAAEQATPSPIAVAQEATLNPNQVTATAAVGTFQAAQTQTMAAQQGIILPTATSQFDTGTDGGSVAITFTPTQQYPDCEHYIQPDSTLSQIARLYNLTTEQLRAYNNITNIDLIKAGDTLIIPACGRLPTPTPTINPTTLSQNGGVVSGPPSDLDNSQGPIQYTVVAGDTVYRLSTQFGVSMSAILNANTRITDINVLSVGQVLLIPQRTKFNTTPTPSAGSIG